MLDPKVFKAYDVRGIHPTELDEDGAYAIGRAYVEHFEPRRIAVGRDMRISAPAMQQALMVGAAEAGADVLDLGLVGTEMVYFAVGELGLEGGVMVTASHNPKEYTGMKIVRRGALPVGGESGLMDVRDRAVEVHAQRGSSGDSPLRGQSPEPYDIWPAYVDRVLSFVDVGAVKPLRVVIDAANGMAGAMLPPVLERLPLDARPYYFEPDGTFPNHEPNPLLPENREFIVAKTLEEEADLGVAFEPAPRFGERGERKPVPRRDHLVVAERLRSLRTTLEQLGARLLVELAADDEAAVLERLQARGLSPQGTVPTRVARRYGDSPA